jgi:hypothetical protein
VTLTVSFNRACACSRQVYFCHDYEHQGEGAALRS